MGGVEILTPRFVPAGGGWGSGEEEVGVLPGWLGAAGSPTDGWDWSKGCSIPR
jgi:hypothetical protein